MLAPDATGIDLSTADPKLAKSIAKFNQDIESFLVIQTQHSERLRELDQELLSGSSKRKYTDILVDIRDAKIESAQLVKTKLGLLNRKNELLCPLITELNIAATQLRDSIPGAIQDAKDRLTTAGHGLDTIPAGGVGIGRMVDANPHAAAIKFEHLARQSESVRELLAAVQDAEAASRNAIQQRSNNSLAIDLVTEELGHMLKSLT
jgi:hypothetical protein